MRRFFLIFLLLLFVSLAVPIGAHAVRYAQCDECGLCKDTSRSTSSISYYSKPARWQECFRCLYPDIGTLPQPCAADELGKTPKIHNIEGTPVPVADNFCDTLIMAPYFPLDKPNSPTIVPKTGRMFTDLGCISVAQNFSDPNASVGVVSALLVFVRNATGGIGLLLIMSAAAQLMLSRGDPEKIRQSKKTLTNVVLGVLFSLFAVFVFQFFAVQVLRIPGLY